MTRLLAFLVRRHERRTRRYNQRHPRFTTSAVTTRRTP